LHDERGLIAKGRPVAPVPMEAAIHERSSTANVSARNALRGDGVQPFGDRGGNNVGFVLFIDRIAAPHGCALGWPLLGRQVRRSGSLKPRRSRSAPPKHSFARYGMTKRSLVTSGKPFPRHLPVRTTGLVQPRIVFTLRPPAHRLRSMLYLIRWALRSLDENFSRIATAKAPPDTGQQNSRAGFQVCGARLYSSLCRVAWVGEENGAVHGDHSELFRLCPAGFCCSELLVRTDKEGRHAPISRRRGDNSRVALLEPALTLRCVRGEGNRAQCNG
jgi:hypothetical protein